jgi:hypothetical protein
MTKLNTYKGGPYQQAVSALTYIDNADYDNMGYASYGFEWWSNPNKRSEGYVTWFSGGKQTWTATSASIGPDDTMNIGQRLISEEPHVSSAHNQFRIILLTSFHSSTSFSISAWHVSRPRLTVGSPIDPSYDSQLSGAGLQTHDVPFVNVHRLRTGIPARRC